MPHILRNGLVAAALVFAMLAEFSAAQAETLASVALEGRNDHVVTGTLTIVKEDDGTHTVALGEDFTLDGAPDPKVAFGDGDKADPATLLAPLKSKTGAQSYTVPAGIDPTAYSEVYIWCDQFSVSLGAAALK